MGNLETCLELWTRSIAVAAAWHKSEVLANLGSLCCERRLGLRYLNPGVMMITAEMNKRSELQRWVSGSWIDIGLRHTAMLFFSQFVSCCMTNWCCCSRHYIKVVYVRQDTDIVPSCLAYRRRDSCIMRDTHLRETSENNVPTTMVRLFYNCYLVAFILSSL